MFMGTGGGGRPLRATNFLLSGRKITMSVPSVCPDVAPKIDKNYHFRLNQPTNIYFAPSVYESWIRHFAFINKSTMKTIPTFYHCQCHPYTKKCI